MNRLLFDGDCAFCNYWINRWRLFCVDKISFEPYQSLTEYPGNLKRVDLEKRIYMICEDGCIFSGAKAALYCLKLSNRDKGLWWMYNQIPGMSFIAENAYRWIAEHRKFMGRLTQFFCK
jgi:predicted DCC family thiol-disulfide oxidoreductase YuxK